MNSALLFVIWNLVTVAIGEKGENSNATFEIVELHGPMPAIVKSTLPSSEKKRQVLSFIHSNPYSGFMPAGAINSKTVEVALDNLRAMPNWLPDYDIQVEMIDDQCFDPLAITTVTRKIMLINEVEDKGQSQHFPLAAGTDCLPDAQRILTLISANFRYTLMSVIPSSIEIADYKRYKAFLGFGEQVSIFMEALTAFIRNLGWQRAAVLTSLDRRYHAADTYTLEMFDRRNITMVWFGKKVPEFEDNQVFHDLKASQARIIIIYEDYLSEIACWFHRYKIYGPNYVLFAMSWAIFDPPKLDWCTQEMRDEVSASLILYGQTPMSMLIPGYVNSAGKTYEQVYADVHSRIKENVPPEYLSQLYAIFYDEILVAGILLNTTETLLKQRNETLSDWTVGSAKLQSNYSSFRQLLFEASSILRARGFVGEYQIDRVTRLDAGYSPTTFHQLVFKGNTSERRLISYYKRSEDAFVETQGIIWRTPDGHPPRDKVSVVRFQLSSNGISTTATLITIGLSAFCAIFAELIVVFVKQRHKSSSIALRFAVVDKFILTGDLLLFSHVLAIAFGYNHDVNINCSAEAVLLVIGYAMTSAGLVGKMLPPLTLNNGKSRKSRQSEGGISVGSVLAKINRAVTFCLLWTLLHVGLILAMLISAPIQSVEVEYAVIPSRSDSSIAFQPTRYVCKLNFGNVTGTIFIAVMGFLHLVLQLYSGFIAYSIRSGLGRLTSDKEAKTIANCCYCQVIILFAGCILSLIGVNDNQYLQLLITCIQFCYSIANVIFVTVSKFGHAEHQAEARELENAKPANVRVLQVKPLAA